MDGRGVSTFRPTRLVESRRRSAEFELLVRSECGTRRTQPRRIESKN
jgi:hypothetical protein